MPWLTDVALESVYRSGEILGNRLLEARVKAIVGGASLGDVQTFLRQEFVYDPM
jgi:hypothetical protein